MSKPLFPWLGGKRKLAQHILPLFPDHKSYVEPFAGAAALYFLKEPCQKEVLNDVNGELMNLYRVVKHHLEELYKQFKWVLVGRQQWEWSKSTPPETLTDIQRAARFLYLQKLAFGGRVSGQSYGTSALSRSRFNLLTLEHDLTEAHVRLFNTELENLHWEDIITKYDTPDTLFYCDPPYWQVTGYGMPFDWGNYQRLASLAKTIQGTIIISINDHPDIRALFQGMEVFEVNYQYTVSGAATDCVELIYGNWREGRPVPRGQQGGLF